MSCQQASRLITTTTSNIASSSAAASTLVVHEDPYVFTETSTTPPILFNAQKLRSKTTLDTQLYSVTTPSTINTTSITTTNSVNTNTTANLQKIVLNGKVAAKTQASLAPTTALTAKTPTTIATLALSPASVATTTKSKATNLKSATQSQKDQRQPKQQQQEQDHFNKSKNVCPQQRLPQLQIQQAQKLPTQLPTQPHYQQQKQQRSQLQVQAPQQQAQQQPKQQTPPPLYSHTPSLWQTPLLLDTISTSTSPPTSPASLPSPPAAAGNGSTTTTPTTLLVSPTSAQPLPPSRFHHTTMAHHLQKVECLKKSKRPNNNNINNNNNNNIANNNRKGNRNSPVQQETTKEATRNATVLSTVPPPLQALHSQKHSETDLNDIPVNVIFRKPSAATGTTASDRSLTPPTESNTPTLQHVHAMPAQQYTSLPLTPPSPTQIQPSFSPIEIHTQNQTHLPAANNNQRSNTVLTQILPNNANVPLNNSHTMTSSMQHASNNDTTICNQNNSNNVPATLKISNKPFDQVCEQKSNTLAKTPSPSSGKPSPNSTTSTPISTIVLQAHKKRKSQFGSLNMSTPTDYCLGSTTAVAVKKLTVEEEAADISKLSEPSCLPYCLQKNWLDFGTVCGREERITQHKNQLKRQALQLLSTRSLQKLPLQLAMRRLVNVDQLLRKHKNHGNSENQPLKQCLEEGCNNPVLVMASHCLQHITNNQTQNIFMACFAKTADNQQCNASVFETHLDKAFCPSHAQQREAYKSMFVEQKQTNTLSVVSAEVQTPIVVKGTQAEDNSLFGYCYNKNVDVNKALPTTMRKRKNNMNNNNNNINIINIKTNSNVNGNGDSMRPLKRLKKSTNVNGTLTPATVCLPNTISSASALPQIGTASSISLTSPPPLSAVMQRKASTTSLESIASNSHSSSSQPLSVTQTAQPTQQQFVNTSLPPPALAPLSNHHATRKINFAITNGGGGSVGSVQAHNIVAGDLKAHEINQIVAQLNMSPYNNNNNFNNMNYVTTTNGHQNFHNNHGNNSINGNSAFYLNANSNSSFAAHNQYTSVLPTSTEELLGHHHHHHNHTNSNIHHNQNMNHHSQSQHHYTMNHHQYSNHHSSSHNDMLSICDNSSAYASSEDTGLGGGLSESELMASAHDVDEIPLGDTRLLEEHDLANVLSALPEDEFNELFTAVRQDECEEVERALELADKNLKTLQQSFGSESDFLSDFLDVNDEILADPTDICHKMEIVPSVMHSPDTSGIDTSTLFIDSSGSNSVGGIVGNSGIGSNSCRAVTDIRGLVQT